jgi:hypothetical protein
LLNEFHQCKVKYSSKKTRVLGVRLSVPKGAVVIVFVLVGIVMMVALANLGRDSAGKDVMGFERDNGGT